MARLPKLWRGYSAFCGKVTKSVARLSMARLAVDQAYVLDHGMPNLDSVLTTLNTNTETNTAIHSSQFDSVRRNGHLLAALPWQK